MRRAGRTALAALLLVVALLTVPYALGETTISYLLNTRGGPTRHTAVFPPGVVAAVVAGVVSLAACGWLVWNLVRAPSRRLWVVVGLLVVLDVALLVVVIGLQRPTF